VTEPVTATNASPVLAAVTRVAVEATGASRGRLMIAAGSAGLHVVAAHGGSGAWRVDNEGGMAGYVMATGQPQVLTYQPASEATSAPSSALCVPCICDDEAVGALELQDKAGGASFTIDDLELAGLLGGIAGVAMARRRAPSSPDPTRLTGDLGRLAATDPARYATIANLVRSLLDA
jgi:GAF domain-containing protein